MLQIQGGLLNTFFKPNGFCVNLLTRTFRRKNDKYPKKARVVVGGGIFPINSVQCLAKKSSDPCRGPHEASVPSFSFPELRSFWSAAGIDPCR